MVSGYDINSYVLFLQAGILWKEMDVTVVKKRRSRVVFATWEVQQEVIGILEKYFVAVVQFADGGALASVLQHCKKEHVAILQSVMEGQKSTYKS
jgi:hypothetical protein